MDSKEDIVEDEIVVGGAMSDKSGLVEQSSDSSLLVSLRGVVEGDIAFFRAMGYVKRVNENGVGLKFVYLEVKMCFGEKSYWVVWGGAVLFGELFC